MHFIPPDFYTTGFSGVLASEASQPLIWDFLRPGFLRGSYGRDFYGRDFHGISTAGISTAGIPTTGIPAARISTTGFWKPRIHEELRVERTKKRRVKVKQ